VRKEHGTFAAYVWHFRDAALLSKDLKKRGFRFVGPTTVYAFMQAVGMVNDHEAGCFRRQELQQT
jgi:DNA-3-methyladenine glycosylase I